MPTVEEAKAEADKLVLEYVAKIGEKGLSPRELEASPPVPLDARRARAALFRLHERGEIVLGMDLRFRGSL